MSLFTPDPTALETTALGGDVDVKGNFFCAKQEREETASTSQEV